LYENNQLTFCHGGERRNFFQIGPPPHRNKAARAALFAFFVLTVFALSGCNVISDFLGLGGIPEEPEKEPGEPDPFSAFKTVYVKEDGDNDDGQGTITSPYRTVGKALEKLAEYYAGNWPGKGGDNEERGAIVILGVVNAGTTGIDNSESIYPPIILYGDPGAALKLTGQGSLITVGSGVTLTLRNIAFNGVADNNASLINVDGGHLILEDGAVITGNTSSEGGAGVQGNAGGITMNSGAIISDNETTATVGGGIYIDDSSPFNFTMNGGTITNNKVRADNGWGGGIGINGDNNTFTMKGGTISGNEASIGGGVMLYAGGVFTMNGGKIKGNTGGFGGGVCVDQSYGSTFTKAKKDAGQGIAGGVIYGNDVGDNLANTAADGRGHAVCYYNDAGSVENAADDIYNTRDKTADEGVYLDGSENDWE
jgi:hypothetical protein